MGPGRWLRLGRGHHRLLGADVAPRLAHLPGWGAGRGAWARRVLPPAHDLEDTVTVRITPPARVKAQLEATAPHTGVRL